MWAIDLRRRIQRGATLGSWTILALATLGGCGARTGVLGLDDSLEPPLQAGGGSNSSGAPGFTAGATNSVGGSPMQAGLDVTKCPRVNGQAWICESQFICPDATYQTVCYYQPSGGVECRCTNLSNGNSALQHFDDERDPCFNDAPSLCRP